MFKWGARKAESPSAAPVPTSSPSETASTTKVLPRVLAALAHEPSPALMDLGPVVGANVSFFGEHLACKIFVEDMFAEVEKAARAGTRETLVETLPRRFTRPPASLDGILAWDVFDYLDKAAGQALAAKLVTLLRPGGILYGFFGQKSGDIDHYTRFVIDSPDTLRLRTVPATSTTRTVIVNRDLNRMFDGLVVAESVLLKSGARETLFRKPS